MGHRLSKIYTRTGDAGTTGLGDGTRVPKDALRIEVMGECDELNAVLGMVLALPVREPIRAVLTEVQHRLFDLGGELCMPGYASLSAEDVTQLETDLDGFNAALPALKEFILPGGGPAAAACHLARTVCRRVERHLVTLVRTEAVNPHAPAYLNRLSDLLFVLGRVLARDEGGGEVLWRNDHGRRRTAADQP
ncbi:MAG TPA: cob(I)yrinic acid a,c-diamide adenosyltransferase [Plasticicumulans sp.]|uniref:cob(I)yrinic acid a,c-diamide adenosyltransferase n=1 Tax=Plasticicumulans sp. TaxID=2307179 RepID=UPI002CBE5A5F|nr:cob(I)yrinic acid a,c-diamide adenosyltransferase [Plasticicumulans sp.]HMW29566.1 cob(I)yrinic acid a,c-diamide adenosyltransferase [Plasticicumulans sp.]HMW42075.1 cob(I)yrinic acid a,c-diamide adenosyltransferase [Plasticicumulans sp.]HMX53142.1 cob(I)yrinic acid a,c-diamide adenosyltransferase [Plasticicumulans sp.]HND98442.1 cob(I)yrinic acid a,c-diamide adenosyltransferase [Plasticicumulans sp.]HNG50254.1 cob(I)yrinic acid a,c-diamide adenosyltransferase [Plasticicumulans sp.]